MDALPGLLALSQWLDEKGQAVKKNVRNPAGLFAAFEQEVQQGAAKDKSAWDASRSVMPEVRAQGIQEINQRGQELGGLLGTFAGVGAKTADAVKLGKAKDMMKAGADPVQVWQQTGWTNQFPDGKWRFEISDKPAKVKPNPADYGQDRLISESVTHPEYFAAYPQLRDMTGTFDKALKGEQGVGSAGFLEDFPHISVTASAKETKPIAMHELQHVVQGEEGFARGGSPDAIKAKNIPPDALAKLDKLQQRIAETPGGTPERFAAAKAFDDMLQQYTPHGQYRRLAGEAEARLTQKRMDLTPAERAARPPWLEFDVPPEQQIVRGLLGEATGPAMWTAYHGSPHKFDKFNLSKIGTGEGAQAYGHGLYFADNPIVAKEYAKVDPSVAPPPNRIFKGQELTPGSPEYHAGTLLENMGLLQARKKVAGWIQESSDDPRMAKEVAGWKKTLDTLNSAEKKSDFKVAPNTNLYKVDIDDAKAPQDAFLQWDKPLSEQPKVAKLLADKFDPTGGEFSFGGGGSMKLTGGGTLKVYDDPDFGRKFVLDMGDKQFRLTEPEARNLVGTGAEGKSIYQIIASRKGGDAAATEYLKSIGIPGIRYLDAGSRGAGSGSMNTVLFDDSLVKILERNGVPISGLLAP